jgi:Flp pilus assembly protein TadG
MVTAEAAACLPVLMLLVAAAVALVQVAAARISVQDAAHEAVRGYARGDPATGDRLAAVAAPGAHLAFARSDATVTVTATERRELLGGWLGPVTITASAVALIDPGPP